MATAGNNNLLGNFFVGSSDLTETDTKNLHGTGTLWRDENGNLYEWTLNAEASTAFVVDDFVVRKVNTTNRTAAGFVFVSTATTFSTLYQPGVALSATAAGSYGWVQVGGVANIKTTSTLAVGDGAKCSTTNKTIDKATIGTDHIIGTCVGATASSKTKVDLIWTGF